MKRMNILLTSSGRRVELLQIFKRVISTRTDKVFATDVDESAPTLKMADKSFIAPQIKNRSYISFLLKIAKNNKIGLLVPLLDPELNIIAKNAKKFSENGICAMISNKKAIEIARDKLKTYYFFKNHGILTPNTCKSSIDVNNNPSKFEFPLIIKPRDGSSGNNVVICRDVTELDFYLKQISKPIIQKWFSGVSVTIDVFGDGEGNTASIIPRKRLKTRMGEVERSITISDDLFREQVLKIVKHFKPFGAINLQCIVTSEGPVFLEINARFGGGYPLSDKAGAAFPKLLIDLMKGKKLPSNLGKYRKGLVMSRYEKAVYQNVAKFKNPHYFTKIS